MGAARHTQRHQEQTQRRMARSGDMRAENDLLLAALKEEQDAREAIVAQRDQALRRENIMRAERDRLRAAVDGITIAMKQRAISAHAVGDGYGERAALDVLALLESYGFGGDQ